MAAAKGNVKENSRENFDLIWSFIEDKLNESVPNYIKYVLSYCGYNTGISIASIEGEDINYCVKEVRSGNVTTFYKSKIGDEDVLEGCNKTCENFEFSRGHLKYLMDIVAMLKKCIEENGADCFKVPAKPSKKSLNKIAQNKKPPKKKMKYSTVTKNASLVLQSYHKQQTFKDNDAETLMEKHMRILADKMLRSLRNHTPVLYMQIANNINNKITELVTVKEPNMKKLCENKPLHESESEEMTARKSENVSEQLTEENSEGFTEKSSEEDSEKPTASMLCPYCWKSINVFFVENFGSPRWNSSNFDRHLKLIHCTRDTENNSGNNDEPEGASGGINNSVGDNKNEYSSDRQTRDADVITDNDTKNETQDVHAVDKIQDARDGSKIKVLRVSNQGQDTNKSKDSQGGRAGTKNQDARGANKIEDDCDCETFGGNADIMDIDIRKEIQDARGVDMIQDVCEGGNKTKDARVSNKGQDTNIDRESQGARGCTKNQAARGAYETKDSGYCEPFYGDADIIMDNDVNNETQDDDNIEDTRDGNKTKDACVSITGQDTNIGKGSQDTRDSETRDGDFIENKIQDHRSDKKSQLARVGNKSQGDNIAKQRQCARNKTINKNARISNKGQGARGSRKAEDWIIEILDISEEQNKQTLDENSDDPESEEFLSDLSCFNVVSSDTDDSDANGKDEKKPLIQSITIKTTPQKEARKKVLKNIRNVIDAVENQVEILETALIRKVILALSNYTPVNCEQNMERITANLTQLVRVTGFHPHYNGEVVCPYCKMIIRVFLKNNRFETANFCRHLKIHHN